MYHLVLFLNCVIMIKAYITLEQQNIFFKQGVNLSHFFTFFKKVIF